MSADQLSQLRDLLQLYYQQELYDPQYGQATWDVLLNVDRVCIKSEQEVQHGSAHSS